MYIKINNYDRHQTILLPNDKVSDIGQKYQH